MEHLYLRNIALTQHLYATPVTNIYISHLGVPPLGIKNTPDRRCGLSILSGVWAQANSIRPHKRANAIRPYRNEIYSVVILLLSAMAS